MGPAVGRRAPERGWSGARTLAIGPLVTRLPPTAKGNLHTCTPACAWPPTRRSRAVPAWASSRPSGISATRALGMRWRTWALGRSTVLRRDVILTWTTSVTRITCVPVWASSPAPSEPAPVTL